MDSFDNYDFSLRAISSLKAAGFINMDELKLFINTYGIPAFKERIKKLDRSLPNKTISEVLEVLIEQDQQACEIYKP